MIRNQQSPSHILGPQASALTSYSETVFSELEGPFLLCRTSRVRVKMRFSVRSSRKCGCRNLTLSFPSLMICGETPLVPMCFLLKVKSRGGGVPATSSLFLLGSTCTEGALVSRESPWLLNLVFKNIEKVMDLLQ